MTQQKSYSWIGDDCPPQWKRVGTIDVADPADVAWALDKGRRIGTIYDGRSGSVAEPCAADTYVEREEIELLARADTYLAANAAESGADELIRELADALRRATALTPAERKSPP